VPDGADHGDDPVVDPTAQSHSHPLERIVRTRICRVTSRSRRFHQMNQPSASLDACGRVPASVGNWLSTSHHPCPSSVPLQIGAHDALGLRVRRALLIRIRAWIEEHLDHPELSPADVAAAHHISLRYLHKLFSVQQSTVAGWIRHRRLERCRRALLDPAQATRPVSAIAARWGILNAAHFSRVFRDAYGLAPAEYRRLNLVL
jgi:AraC-like DNA-binding protein